MIAFNRSLDGPIEVEGIQVAPLGLRLEAELPEFRQVAAVPAEIPVLFPGKDLAPLGPFFITHGQRPMEDQPVDPSGPGLHTAPIDVP